MKTQRVFQIFYDRHSSTDTVMEPEGLKKGKKDEDMKNLILCKCNEVICFQYYFYF